MRCAHNLFVLVFHRPMVWSDLFDSRFMLAFCLAYYSTHTHVPLPFFLNHHTHSTACVLCRCPAALARTATNKSAGSTCWPSVRQRPRPQQPRQLRPRPRKPRPRPLPLPPQLPPRLRRQRPPPLPQPRRSGNAHQGSSFRATHARRAQMGRFVPMMRTTTVRATRG